MIIKKAARKYSNRNKPVVITKGMLRLWIRWKGPFQWLRNFSSGTSPSGGRYRPRRAIMYVPGADQRKMDKVPLLGVDTAVFDIEDGVAADQKVVPKYYNIAI